MRIVITLWMFQSFEIPSPGANRGANRLAPTGGAGGVQGGMNDENKQRISQLRHKASFSVQVR